MPTTTNPEKIRIPAPILTIIHVIMVILLGNLFPLPFPMPAIFPWLGLVIAALGLGLGILALKEFRRVRASADPKKTSGGLVTTGVYRYTRNPTYLGFVLILIGFSLSMRTYWGFFLVLSLVALMNNLVIKNEESYLENKFKVQYTDYASHVRRWV